MINLIPNEEKKKMVRDFYFRLLTVFFFVLGFSMVVAFVAIVPSYVLSTQKKGLANDKLATQKTVPDQQVDRKVFDDIAVVDNQLSLIENAKTGKFLVSQKVVNEIVLKKMPDIKINEISYKDEPEKGKSIIIRGVAASRERLLLFRRVLEDDTAFKNVDLPISNFVKGSNISFSLTLIPS